MNPYERKHIENMTLPRLEKKLLATTMSKNDIFLRIYFTINISIDDTVNDFMFEVIDIRIFYK